MEPDVAFDQAAIGMAMVDFEGHFLEVNEALCELLGRSKPELLTARWQDVTYPDDIGVGEREVERTQAGKDRTFRLAKRYIHGDGRLIWVLLSVSLICAENGDPLCLFTQAVDITEQRRAEDRYAWLAAIVESSDDAILSMSLDGTISTWNRGAEHVYGHDPTAILGKNVTTIMAPECRDEIVRFLGVVARGQSITNHETIGMRNDDSLVDVWMTMSPIRGRSGDIVGASTITRDITERKRIASELDTTLGALETALSEAGTAEERSRRFLSDAAHHLRNPVAGIRSCVETMLRGCPAPDRERLFVEIIRDTSHVSRIVDRLLRMSRLDQGESLYVERVDLVEVCGDAVDRARALAPDLRIEMVSEPIESMQFDRDAVREALDGILDNGARHAKKRLDVAVYQSGGMANVRVSDDGPGLAPSDVEQAFEPFVSLDGTGSGLGLAISRAVARAHGGDVVYGDDGFVLRLPMARGVVSP